ncbi:IucA/IucC family protein [Streptacidiphilus fuscans]|uniref:IucA/IucC family siderophore biosynthesis protein n=1 Tax=Streptacidiphilus fuscans TaxID=2789292 RepID=A0A931FH75_9ACTN|nr:IucA/IucC family siderophore biosynthesis protein [Streptacidiphilus fuscans]MBF9071571.1 IucA/IucC family siderophore biosynthesis protein [Streptacidiphilus fuscans]
MHATDSPVLRPAEAVFAAELHRVRPELDAGFAAELPGARAAVLARLWRALRLEPLPLSAADRARLSGPDRRAYDIGAPDPGYAVRLGATAYTHPAALLEALRLPGSDTLLGEIEHSVVSLALSRAGARARSERKPVGLIDSTDSIDLAAAELITAERSIVDGHPYHPCCRSRPGFSVADQLAYAPEHGADIELELIAVPERDALLTGAWPEALRDRASGTLLLPAHPWQARTVLPPLGFAPSGRRLTAAPLMSVRTLAPLATTGPHLKTSLSLRMTSSIRDISGGSVRNALAVSGLLDAVVGRLDGSLRITRNLASCAALVDAEPSPDLAVIVRQPPTEGLREGERVLPLAALAERPPTGLSAARWLTAFARLAWPALLRLLDWGVALEAHGQNLLVVLDPADRPVRLVYRDLADIRVSPARLARAGIDHPPVTGHVVSDDPVVLHRKLFGSLVGGAFGGLVSGFGGGDRSMEARLWQTVAAEARAAAAQVLHDPADRDALLHEPLPLKALTLMRLDGTAPGDRWTTADNPLVPPDGQPQAW